MGVGVEEGEELGEDEEEVGQEEEQERGAEVVGTPVRRSVAEPSVNRLLETGAHASPAFVRDFRLSGSARRESSLRESIGFDPFKEEELEDGSPRKRMRLSYGTPEKRWRVMNEPRNLNMEFAEDQVVETSPADGGTERALEIQTYGENVTMGETNAGKDLEAALERDVISKQPEGWFVEAAPEAIEHQPASSPMALSQSKPQMAPPPLPKLSVALSSPPAVESEITETQNNPLAPKLQPVSGTNLPLPSPFPASETTTRSLPLPDHASSPNAIEMISAESSAPEIRQLQRPNEIPDTYSDEEAAFSSPIRIVSPPNKEPKFAANQKKTRNMPKSSPAADELQATENEVISEPVARGTSDVLQHEATSPNASVAEEMLPMMPLTSAEPKVAQTQPQRLQQTHQRSVTEEQDHVMDDSTKQVEEEFQFDEDAARSQLLGIEPSVVESTTPKGSPPKRQDVIQATTYETDELYDITPPRETAKRQTEMSAHAATSPKLAFSYNEEPQNSRLSEDDDIQPQASYLQSGPAFKPTYTPALDAPSMLTLDGASHCEPQSPSKTSPWARPDAILTTPASRMLGRGEKPAPLSAPLSEKDKERNRTFRNLFGFRSPSPTKNVETALRVEGGVETSPWGFSSVQRFEDDERKSEAAVQETLREEPGPARAEVPRGKSVTQGAVMAKGEAQSGVTSDVYRASDIAGAPNEGAPASSQPPTTASALHTQYVDDSTVLQGVDRDKSEPPSSANVNDVTVIEDDETSPQPPTVLDDEYAKDTEEQDEEIPDVGPSTTTSRRGSAHSTVPSLSLKAPVTEPLNASSLVELSSSSSATSPQFNEPPDVENLDLSQPKHAFRPQSSPQHHAQHLKAETVADSFDSPASIVVDDSSRLSTRDGPGFDRGEAIEEEALKVPPRVFPKPSEESPASTSASVQEERSFPMPTPTTSFEPTAKFAPSQELGSLSPVPVSQAFGKHSPDELARKHEMSPMSRQHEERSQQQQTAVVEISSSSPPSQHEYQMRQVVDQDDYLLSDFVEQEHIGSPQSPFKNPEESQSQLSFANQEENAVDDSTLAQRPALNPPAAAREDQLYPDLPPTPLDSQSQLLQTADLMHSNQAGDQSERMLPPTPQLTKRASENNAGDQLNHMVDEQAQPQAQSTTPKGTPSFRKSFSGRLSHVPDVISAWFSPRRSTGVTQEKPPPLVPVEDRVNHTTAIRDTTPTPANGTPLPPSTAPSRLEKQPNPNQGLSTPHAYFTPLAHLDRSLNAQSQSASASPTLDILAVVISNSKPAERAKAGPRDYYTLFKIGDPSLPPEESKRVEIFRPWKATLPFAQVGDIVLLRGFVVKSRKRTAYLLSTEASAWCVWRFAEVEKGLEGAVRAKRRRSSQGGLGVREEIKGPPVEFGDVERERVDRLREWWVGEHGEGRFKEAQGEVAEATEGVVARL